MHLSQAPRYLTVAGVCRGGQAICRAIWGPRPQGNPSPAIVAACQNLTMTPRLAGQDFIGGRVRHVHVGNMHCNLEQPLSLVVGSKNEGVLEGSQAVITR